MASETTPNVLSGSVALIDFDADSGTSRRVVEALEAAIGPEWQTVARTLS